MGGILRPLPSKEAHRETIEKIHEVSRERTYSDGRLRELVKREIYVSNDTVPGLGRRCHTLMDLLPVVEYEIDDTGVKKHATRKFFEVHRTSVRAGAG